MNQNIKTRARAMPVESEVGLQAIEAFFLHFFTNVNLTAAASEALGPEGFSMTRHRVLGFATLTPGLTVGDMLRILRVSHQNLNEPLRRLIKEGYLVAKIDDEDRRQKRLFATPKGARLYRKVQSFQVARIERAFAAAGPDATRGFFEVHRHLVEDVDLVWIDKIARASAI